MTAVAHAAQVDGRHRIILEKERRDEVPPVRMSAAAMHEQQAGLAALTPLQIMDGAIRHLDELLRIWRLDRAREPFRWFGDLLFHEYPLGHGLESSRISLSPHYTETQAINPPYPAHRAAGPRHPRRHPPLRALASPAAMYDWFGVAFLRDLQAEVWLPRLADVELIINTSSVLFEQLSALPIIPVLGDGQQRINPIHIEDLCRVIAHLVDHWPPEPQRHQLAGPQVLSLTDFHHQLRR
jgi:hypothetical protein